MTSKAVTPKLPEDVYNFLTATFGRPNTGANFVLNAFKPLYHQTLAALKGRFTREELHVIIFSMNGSTLAPQSVGRCLAGNINVYFMDFDSAKGKPYDVDGNLLTTIKRLTLFERACLEIWARNYYSETNENPNGYVDALVES